MAQSALQFNGTSQYATMGSTSTLNGTSFTVECWFRRDGAGTPASTGTGGLPNAVPLVTKGAAEAESPANLNANYMLVLSFNTPNYFLAMDFEDTAGGVNHPLVGTTPIAAGTWYHAALVSSVSGSDTTITLYLNGAVEATQTFPGVQPESTTIQHFALATTLRSNGTTTAGFFQGVIDEARFWNVARTQPEIQATLNFPVTSGGGLVARWGLNEGAGLDVFDSVGTPQNGALVGSPTWVSGANAAPALAAAGEVTVSFRQGINGYTSVLDTTLDASAPGTAQNNAATLTIDGGGDGATNERHALIRFNNIFGEGVGQIPPGALIQSANLTVFVSNITANQTTMHRMLQDWTSAATWNSFVGGVQANDTEAATTADVTLGSFGAAVNQARSANVTNSLQTWHADPSANFGWAWLPGGNDGLVFDSSEGTTSGNRPRLSVTYLSTPNFPPATPVLVSPADEAVGISTSPTLSVTVDDPEDSAMDVTFYGRETAGPVGEDFTIIALPDTQFYSCNNGSGCPTVTPSGPALYNGQTQWIVNNRISKNIVYVAHLGDCVEHGNAGNGGGDPDSEWNIANAALSLLENPLTTMLADGIPYGIAVGNHDQTPMGVARSGGDEGATTSSYNNFFGRSRFDGRSYYGGRYDFGAPATYPNNNDNHYDLFSAGGMDFIAIAFEWDDTNNATRTAVLAWANNLLQAHSNRRAIVYAHTLIGTGNPGAFANQGQAVYDALKGNPNLFLMLCGHVPGEGRRQDTFNGNTVHTLLSDYQSRSNGGDGFLRILEFSPANNEIRVKTYSPTRNGGAGEYETDADSQFTISYDMGGGAQPFVLIGAHNNVPDETNASIVWTGLEANKTYEWYASVTDGLNTVTGPVWSFTTTCTSNGECDDGNACTDDVCDDGACIHTNNADTCDDGDACTIDDACTDGACAGTPVTCPPGQACDGLTGNCVFPPATISFQNGDVNGYLGTVDTYLHAGSATTNLGAAVEVQVDAPGGTPADAKHGLIRFDNIFGTDVNQIPPGATITSAVLTVNVTNESANLRSFHRMLQTWASSDTWNLRVNGIQADDTEARSIADSISEFVGTGLTNIDVTADIAAWQAGASRNGWAIFCANTDGWAFSSADATTQTLRPKLTVTYQPAAPCLSDAACDDGNACTDDACVDYLCVHTPIDCDDSNPCTVDTCDAQLGCQYAPANCDDGDGCTVDDCNPETGCTHEPLDCDDANPCTADSCQPANLAALSLSGSSQYVNLGTGAAVTNFGTNSFTIEGWVRPAANAGGTNVSLFRLGRSGSFSQAIVQLLANTNAIAASVETTTASTQVDTATGITIPLNTWSHFAAVADRTPGAQRLRLYVNGNLVSDVSATVWASNPVSSTDASVLGATRSDTGSLNAYFNGALDEVRLWSSARSQAEIQAGMNTQIASGPGLTARWGLNEGAGTTAADSVGGNNGILTGGASWLTAGLVNLGEGGCTNTPIPGCCVDVSDCDDGNLCTIDTCESGSCFFTPVNCGIGQVCNPATGLCEIVPITVTFQQGVNGYSGAIDTYIEPANPNTNRSAATPLIVDLAPLTQILMRFDDIFGFGPGQIPPGATIQSATLTINVTNDTAQGALLHRMLQSWAGSDTWNTLGAGVQANDIEAVATADVTLTVVPTGSRVVTVTNSLQAWSNAPESNLGWVWLPPADDDSLQFGSAEASPVSSRPLLSVTYLYTVGCDGVEDCDDGNPCTADTCDGGTCVFTPIPDCCLNAGQCNDGNPCTDDSCVDNECIFTPNSASCDDGDACTENDTCADGTCAGTPIAGCCNDPSDCDDGNPCTIDDCYHPNIAALSFDGVNDYVTMGVAPGLGATSFTIECWFKWTGGSSAASAGTGGLDNVIPLVAKGRSEQDTPANLNCNYFLGIRNNTLVADYEDTASGLNHPVAGSTTITQNVWHHAAVTFDPAGGAVTWSLYLDGVAQTLCSTSSCTSCNTNCSINPSATPESQSIQHFSIGSALNSTGVPVGYFGGIIDEVRVWNVARSGTQIQAAMNTEIEAATGLIGRWGLNEGAGLIVADSTTPAENGTLTNGPTWVLNDLPSFGGGGCVHTPIEDCCVDADDCDDGNHCTIDTCESNACVHTSVEDGTPCANGEFCDGLETCQAGICVDSVDPCIDLAHCDELNDMCLECLSNEECDDSNPCTIDTCENNICVNTPIAPPNAAISVGPFMCVGTSGIATVADAGIGATYDWSILGGTIDAGQGTSSISFTATSPAGVDIGILVSDSAGCSAADSASVSTSHCADITVEIPGLVMNPPGITDVSRETIFTLYRCDVGLVTDMRVIDVDYEAAGAIGTATVRLAGVHPDTAWLSVQTGHSLRRVISIGIPPSGVVQSTVSLVSGDLRTPMVPQDGIIDILDFAILASRWGLTVNDCQDGLPEDCDYGADVTGDGQQSSADFQAIQINYFLMSDPLPGCGGGIVLPPPIPDEGVEIGGTGRPMPSKSPKRSIPTVDALRLIPRAGLADLTNDGIIDSKDIELFARKKNLTLRPEFRAKLNAVGVSKQ